MRYWALVLHFYQPPTQELGLTKHILDTCYLPLLRMLVAKSGYGLTVNISGSLLVQLQQLGADEFFDLVKKLIDQGKIEVVNSVMYHPLMPLTPVDVIDRQSMKNADMLKTLVGVEQAEGFFPPELAINQASLDVVKSKYVFVDETAVKTYKPLVRYGGKYLLVNNRQVCDLLRSYPTQLTVGVVEEAVKKQGKVEQLVVSVHDAELFGHHYAERLQVLADMLDSVEIKCITASEAIAKFDQNVLTQEVIVDSTWQIGPGFYLWNHSALQKRYLKFLELVTLVTAGQISGEALDYLDQGYSSCYLYWLSNWPWWHPELVEKGARSLVTCVRMANIESKLKLQIEAEFHKLLHVMWHYHWSGRVEAEYKRFDLVRNIKVR